MAGLSLHPRGECACLFAVVLAAEAVQETLHVQQLHIANVVCLSIFVMQCLNTLLTLQICKGQLMFLLQHAVLIHYSYVSCHESFLGPGWCYLDISGASFCTKRFTVIYWASVVVKSREINQLAQIGPQSICPTQPAG